MNRGDGVAEYVLVPRTELRAARQEIGLTQKTAALAAGYKGKSAWSMVESGANTPPLDVMKRMARVVKKPLADVFPEVREEGTDEQDG
jgi:DNA-binding XRE family transcriptional regulator